MLRGYDWLQKSNSKLITSLSLSKQKVRRPISYGSLTYPLASLRELIRTGAGPPPRPGTILKIHFTPPIATGLDTEAIKVHEKVDFVAKSHAYMYLSLDSIRSSKAPWPEYKLSLRARMRYFV